jgi:hypothetical protein
MSTEHRLHVVSSATDNGLDLSNRPPPPDDGDALAAVFHCIKKIREVASSVCCTHLGHGIRLSDLAALRTLSPSSPAGVGWRTGSVVCELATARRKAAPMSLQLQSPGCGFQQRALRRITADLGSNFVKSGTFS